MRVTIAVSSTPLIKHEFNTADKKRNKIVIDRMPKGVTCDGPV